jgi:hypothetical protein
VPYVSFVRLGAGAPAIGLLAIGAACALAGLGARPASARPADCRPVEAVFYESSDWARLANGLAANPSPCAAYYVTIPALAGDKTQMRPAAAAQVRALGPNFHALAEINYSAWQSWVASTGNSWYSAGVEARRRMAAAGFDVAGGDRWVVNELSSAVRTGAGAARQNVRDLVRGLYEGDGTETQAKGMVFVVGVGQNGLSFPQYKATLESWLQDQNFWADLSSYVSDFFQEAYGDVRNYAVAGQDAPTRAAALNAYLQHLFTLAVAPGAPAAESAARNFLSAAYGALANASWAWGSAYGWTQVPSEVMADYVSAQTYAMRLSGSVRLGFAWNPLNSMGLSATDFASQVAGVLARLAGSIHETDAGDPAQACAATGCAATVNGAALVPGWSTFAQWTPTTATFTSAPVSLTPGVPSGPITLQLQTGGVNTTLPVASTVIVSSSSRTGAFATDPAGPWAPTLTLTLPPGTGAATFYALDTAAGSPTITANLGGAVTTQIETIAAPPQPTPPPPPPAAHVASLRLTPQQGRIHLALQVVGAGGEPLQARVALAVLHGRATIATASALTDPTGAFALTARPRLQLGCYRVRLSALSAAGHVWDEAVPATSYCVRTLPAHVITVAYGRKNGRLRVGVRATDDAGRALRAKIEFAVARGGSKVASTAGRTGASGWLALTARAKPPLPGCYRVIVNRLSAPGYRWDGISPARRYCIRP